MAIYIKKRIPVEAEQYKKGMEDGFTKVYDVKNSHPIKPYLDTLEGRLTFNEGDYIVTGIKGERWAVRKDIFEETYELFEDEYEVVNTDDMVFDTTYEPTPKRVFELKE